MKRLRILVTGATGQLGTELKRHVPANVELSALNRGELDLAQPDAARATVARLAPDWVINAAAYTAVDKAEGERELAYRVNRDGPQALGEAAQRCGARLLQVSTDFVFDGSKGSPYLPADPPAPLGVYGASKHAGEEAARAATGGSAVILRTAWVYAGHGANFARTMLRLLRERPELKVVADQVGTPTHAGSLAEAIWKLIAAEVPAGSTLHFTDDGVASWFDFAIAIREAAQQRLGRALPPILPIRTQDYPTPARRPAYSVLDKTATYALIGPGRHWREPVAGVVDALLA